MIVLYLLPVLLLVFPTSINSIISISIVFTLLVISLIRTKINIKSEFKKADIKKLICSFFITLFLCVWFCIKWYPSTAFQYISSSLNLNSMILLVLFSVILGFFSFMGITVLLSFFIEKIRTHHFMNQYNISSKVRLFYSLLLSCLLYSIQSNLRIYSDIDNTAISLVLNGAYSSQNVSCFVSPILSKIVKLIDYFFPTADGYLLFMEIIMFLSFWLLGYILFSVCKSKSTLGVIYLVLFFVVLDLNVFHCNFTIFTGVLCCIGLLGLFAFYIKKIGIIAFSFSIVVFWSGCMYRFESMLLFVPYIILILVVEVFSHKRRIKQIYKRILVISLSIILCITGNFIIKEICFLNPEYAASVEYNSARSELFDWKVKEWKDVKSDLESIGVSENDYDSLKESLLADTEVITNQRIKNIAQIAKLDFYQKIKYNSNTQLSGVLYMFQNDGLLILFTLFFVFFLFFAIFFSNLSKIRILEIILSYFGTILIILFFAVAGRIPLYVIKTVFICNLTTVLSILIVDLNCIKFTIPSCNIKSVLIGLFSCLLLFSFSCADKNGDRVFKCLTANNQKTIFEDLDNSKKYIWAPDCYNKYIEENFSKEDILPSNSFLKYNITDGKWTYGQDYFKDYLHRNNISNPMKALLNENVYYIATKNRKEMVLKFLNEHYSQNIEVSFVKSISDMDVWKFSVSN